MILKWIPAQGRDDTKNLYYYFNLKFVNEQTAPQQIIITQPQKWYRRWWAIVLWVLLSLLVLSIILGGILINIISKKAAEIRANQPQIYTDTEGKYSFSTGTSTPKITIVEFSDFSCPYSKKSFSTIRSIGLKYKDSVKIVYRDYPNISENSLTLAMAARCAGEQDKFWQMHDKLFQNQGINNDEDLTKLAVQSGVDLNKYNSCMTDKRPLAALQEDMAAAEKLGVGVTPTWFINGQKIQGDIPADIWENIISELSK